MSSPRPMAVFLMVAAIVLIGLYLLGVGVGSGPGRRPSMDAIRSSLGSFGSPSSIACADLAAPGPGSASLPPCACDAQGQMVVARPGCAAVVGSTLPWRRRTLKLRSPATTGSALGVQVSADQGRTVVRGNLADPSDFPVPPGGADLTLSCAVASCLAIIRR